MSERDLFTKRLGEQEKTALNVLRNCGLSHITIPYFVKDTTLYMTCGTPVDAGRLSTVQLYRECLKDLHSVTAPAFTPRIYAFYGTDLHPYAGERYGAFLKRQVDALQAGKGSSQYKIINTVYSYCAQALAQGFVKHRAALDSLTSFSLLHGDLHCGNILELNGIYKLIDFEYLMFGPRQVEIAFLLFWTFISGEEPFPNSALLRKRISVTCAEMELDSEAVAQIEDVFFPLFLFLVADSLTKGRYADPFPFQKGLKSFYENMLPEL